MSQSDEREMVSRGPAVATIVTFKISSDRAEAVVDVLTGLLQELYRAAWLEAVGHVMTDNGWSKDDSFEMAGVMSLVRQRSGRPREMQGKLISEQLAAAVHELDRHLDEAVSDRPLVVGKVAQARALHPVAFSWRITEPWAEDPTTELRTRQLMGDAYFDVAAPIDGRLVAPVSLWVDGDSDESVTV